MSATIRTLFLCLGAGAALTGPATAAEQLTMPFSCSVDRGTVLLAPTAPQTYKIYGHREKKQLTTCSPYDPRNCHNWFIYRFDLDCGGSRTSWQSVVAALSLKFADAPGSPRNPGHYDGQAGARRIPPWAAGGPARPYRGGVSPAVDFPPGFAPNPLRVAKFERTKVAPAHIPLPLKKPFAPKKPILTAPAQVAEIAPSARPAAAPPASGGKVDASKADAAGKADAARKADAASETPPAEDATTAAAKPKPVQIALSSGNGEATGSLPKSGATSTLWRDAWLVFTVTFAVLLALTALLLLRRRRIEAMPVPFALLPLKRVTRSLFTNASNAGPASDDADLQSDGSAKGLGSRSLRLWDEDWLPATRNEALEVLGVDPDARADTMKTTVKRLRRALHPDHAFDEEDRLLRERRLKQINVAWDIVSGKRHAA